MQAYKAVTPSFLEKASRSEGVWVEPVGGQCRHSFSERDCTLCINTKHPRAPGMPKACTSIFNLACGKLWHLSRLGPSAALSGGAGAVFMTRVQAVQWRGREERETRDRLSARSFTAEFAGKSLQILNQPNSHNNTKNSTLRVSETKLLN